MTIQLPSPVRSRFDQLKVRSHRILRADFRRAALDAVTGQPHTFTQTTGASALDVTGAAYTGAVGRPAWSVVDGRTGLIRTATTTLHYEAPARIVECSGLVAIVDQGALGATGTVLARIGLGVPRWTLTVGASRTVVATLTNAAAATSIATSGTDVAALGQLLRIWWGIEFVDGDWQALIRTQAGGGEWSATVTGTLRARDATEWGKEGGEGFVRYYVAQAT